MQVVRRRHVSDRAAIAPMFQSRVLGGATLKRSPRLAVFVAAALATLLAGASPAVAGQRFVFETAKGVLLDLPSIADIASDCDAIQAALAKIDASRYRTGPRPDNPADQPVFDYETKLSAHRYRCDTSAAAATIMPAALRP